MVSGPSPSSAPNGMHVPLQPTVQPAAPYSSRPPSPPYIHVPPPVSTSTHHAPAADDGGDHDANRIPVMTIHPSPAAIHTTGLSPADLLAVTRGAPQSACDPAVDWVYESRRAAQPVLDFLFLGPASVVKDRAFLVREGITMVLCARDARFAHAGAAAGADGMLVMGVKRAVAGMDVAVEGLDVADGRELVGAFSVAARRVNAHVLAAARDGSGRRGRVLVVCETGNDRSAAVVAAYLMAVYGLDTVGAVQFVQLRRFCVALGDDFKFRLQAYGDILRARGDVGVSGLQAQMRMEQQLQQPPQQQPHQQQQQQHGGTENPEENKAKRRIDQTMGDAGDGGDEDMADEMDDERYAGRRFAPFVEREH